MAKKNYADRDLELFTKWNSTKGKKDFQELYRHFGGAINTASRKAAYGSTIPQAVFKLEAAQQFHDALYRFNPNAGVKLSTYMHNTIENKLKRINYKYQNIARRPERAQAGVYHINLFNNEKAMLQENLNREPSTQELADVLGWSKGQVETMVLEDRRDLSLNKELEDMNVLDEYAAADNAVLDALYYDMSGPEQLVYDYAQGTHGKQKLVKPSGKVDLNAISRATNMSISQVTKSRNKIVAKLKGV